MPCFLTPLHEVNNCHTPAGSPAGGQFCSTPGRDWRVAAEEFSKRVRAWGEPNFFDPREVVLDNEAVLEIPHPFDEGVYLTGLRALEHQKGIGTKVMQRLTALADELGVTLMLGPTPMAVHPGQKAIPKKKLVEFYKRFGFSAPRSGLMRRKPQKT